MATTCENPACSYTSPMDLDSCPRCDGPVKSDKKTFEAALNAPEAK